MYLSNVTIFLYSWLVLDCTFIFSCKCGKHHCPHTNENFLNHGEEPCTATEYNDTFIPKGAEKAQSFKPTVCRFKKLHGTLFYFQQTAFQSNAPLDGMTTNRADYIPKQADRAGNYKPAQTYLQSDSPFDGETTNKADYYQKQPEAQQSFKPAQSAFRSTDPFQGNTTNKADYDRKQVLHTQRIYLNNFRLFL